MALIKCPECGENISDLSEVCIHCGYPIKAYTANGNNDKTEKQASTSISKNGYSSTGRGVRFFAILILIGIIASFVLDFQSCGNNSSSKSSSSLEQQAWVCAQDIVEKNLKSPSTAKFCKYPEATIRKTNGNDYIVYGYVDAQNTFGATVRAYFTVTLTLTESGYKNGYVSFDYS